LGVLWALPPPEPPLLLLVEVNLRTPGPDLRADTRAAVRGPAVGVQDGLTLAVEVQRADLILLLRSISSLFLHIFFYFSLIKKAPSKKPAKTAKTRSAVVSLREAQSSVKHSLQSRWNSLIQRCAET
jgi:hypothetical protein